MRITTLRHVFLMFIFFLTACGGGRSLQLLETDNPNGDCTVNSDCSAGQICNSSTNMCETNPDNECISDADCVDGTCDTSVGAGEPFQCVPDDVDPGITSNIYEICEYYGYDTYGDPEDGLCDNGMGGTYNLYGLTRKTSNPRDDRWKTGAAFMRVAEGKSVLDAGGYDHSGDGVKVAIIGKGVKASSGFNVASTHNFGYIEESANENSLYQRIYHPNIDRSITEGNAYGSGTAHLYSESSLQNWKNKDGGSSTITDYQAFIDANCGDDGCDGGIHVSHSDSYLDLGSDSSAVGFIRTVNLDSTEALEEDDTALASVIASNSLDEVDGVAQGAEILSYRVTTTMTVDTEISEYEEGYNPVGDPIYESSNSYEVMDNTAQSLLDSIESAKENNADIILLSDVQPDLASSDDPNYIYKVKVRKSGGGYNTEFGTCIMDFIGASDADSKHCVAAEGVALLNNANRTAIKTNLADTNHIYITSIDNDIIRDMSDEGSFNTLLYVADVEIDEVTYNDDTSFDEITLGDLVSDYDCSSVDSGSNCIIAPSRGFGSTGGSSAEELEEMGVASVSGVFASAISAFPAASKENIMNKMLDTATDASNITGCTASGGSIDCGDGMLDYLAFVTASTIDGEDIVDADGNSFNLSDFHIELTTPYGDMNDFSGSILAKAIFLDDYNFHYNASLDSKVTKKPYNGLNLANYLFDSDTEVNSTRQAIGKGLAFNITNSESKDLLAEKVMLDVEEKSETKLSNFEFNHNVSDTLSLNFAYDSHFNDKLYYSDSLKQNQGYLGLTESSQDIFSVTKDLSKKLSVKTGWINSDDVTSYLTSFNYGLNDGKLALNLGLMNEQETMLGASFDGGFAIDQANTHFVNLQFVKNIKDIELFGSFTTGITSADTSGSGVISNVSDISSQELNIGAKKKMERASIGVSYSEPLRITSGSMEFTVPTTVNANGEIINESGNVSLKPLGKERNYEIFFDKDIGKDSTIGVNLVRTYEGGNDVSSKTEDAIMFKFSTKF